MQPHMGNLRLCPVSFPFTRRTMKRIETTSILSFAQLNFIIKLSYIYTKINASLQLLNVGTKKCKLAISAYENEIRLDLDVQNVCERIFV